MFLVKCPKCQKDWDGDEYICCPICDEYCIDMVEDGIHETCPQCGANVEIKVNSDGTLIEYICDDCSYYSVDVE